MQLRGKTLEQKNEKYYLSPRDEEEKKVECPCGRKKRNI